MGCAFLGIVGRSLCQTTLDDKLNHFSCGEGNIDQEVDVYTFWTTPTAACNGVMDE